MTIATSVPAANLASPQQAVPATSPSAAAAGTLTRQTAGALTANTAADFRPQQQPDRRLQQGAVNARIQFISQGAGGASAAESAPENVRLLLVQQATPAPLPASGPSQLLNNPATSPFVAQYLAQAGAQLSDDDIRLLNRLSVQATPTNPQQAKLQQQQQQLSDVQSQLLQDIQIALGQQPAQAAPAQVAAANAQAAAAEEVEAADVPEEGLPQPGQRRDTNLRGAASRYYRAAQSRLDIFSLSGEVARIA